MDKDFYSMTNDERAKLRQENPPTVSFLERFEVFMGWSWKGCGFGELYIKFDEVTGKYIGDQECMSKESVRKFLHALADHVADNLEIK